MDKFETHRNVQIDPLEHPAVRAWRELQSVPVEPERIEILKGKLPRRTQRTRKFVCRLVGVGPAGSAVIGKWYRRPKAVIESTIYQEILPSIPISSINYYGMVEEANGECNWLFLEDAGEKAYSPLIEDHRVLSAQWLAQMHASATNIPAPNCLPDKGPKYYLKRLQSVRDVIMNLIVNYSLKAGDLVPLKAIVSHCDVLESHWEQVEELCERLPRTLVHGDFVAKNLRVRSSQVGLVLLPFDWGQAGWGVPATDIMHVEVAAYWLVVRGHWPWLNVHAIQRLAVVGKIFRCLDAIYWEFGGFKYEWLHKTIRCMKIYESWLADAIRAARFND